MYCWSLGGTSSAITPRSVSRHRPIAPRAWGRSSSLTRARILPFCMQRGHDSSRVVFRRPQDAQRGGSSAQAASSREAESAVAEGAGADGPGWEGNASGSSIAPAGVRGQSRTCSSARDTL